jgi:hypothetical protein
LASEGRRPTGWILALAAVAGAGCAGAPAPPAPGLGVLWGVVTLVPPPGVTPGAGGAAYGDRRTAHAERVDYSHPGFVVVFADGFPPPAGRATLSLASTRGGLRFVPEAAAVPVGGVVSVRNDDAAPHVISSRSADLLWSLPPGESIDLPAGEAGEWSFHALDADAATAVVFVAPGPFATVARSGRWELRDLPPGACTLRAWHPRFPAVAHPVEVRADTVTRVDVTLGAGRPHGEPGR